MCYFDDWDVNIDSVSELGVHCVHTTNGMTREAFDEALEIFGLNGMLSYTTERNGMQWNKSERDTPCLIESSVNSRTVKRVKNANKQRKISGPQLSTTLDSIFSSHCVVIP